MSGLSYLDDPEWSIDLDDEPTRAWLPIGGLIVALVLWASIAAFKYWSTHWNTHTVYSICNWSPSENGYICDENFRRTQ